jgi:putative cell wall-binding protein
MTFKRVVVGFALVLLAFAPAAFAGVQVTTERIAGPDRYSTAAAAAVLSWETKDSDRVVLASGQSWADSLAAVVTGLPLLLTERDALPAATREAIKRIDPSHVVIYGGTAVIGTGIEDELRGQGREVERRAGPDRYATAAAGYENEYVSEGRATSVVVASGETFADAIAASPILGLNGLLLTRRDELPAVTERLIREGVSRVLIVGGTASVSSVVEDALRRICHSDSQGGYCVQVGRIAGANPGIQTVQLARGDQFPDALAGGSFAQRSRTVLVLTLDPNNLSTEAREYLRRHRDSIQRINVFGDNTAVSDAVVEEAKAAATL